jgi:hypothetical protein
MINMKGYAGGFTRYRKLFIGDGRGGVLMAIYGTSSGHVINIYSSKVSLIGLANSGAGLQSGGLYRDGNDLKIV